MAEGVPRTFNIRLPPGYRLTAEPGIDTTVLKLWKPRGLEIHYDANDLPRSKPLDVPPVESWIRKCFWGDTFMRTISTDVVCSRRAARDDKDFPAFVTLWFPDLAVFSAEVKSARQLDELLSIVLTYSPGTADRSQFVDGPTLERMIAHGWNVRRCGRHVMEEAIAWNADDVIGVLARRGVDPNQTNSNNQPFIYQAAAYSTENTVRVLFENGARPVGKVFDQWCPPVTVGMQSLGMLDLFVMHGLDVNATDPSGNTAFLMAVEAKRWDNVIYLLERGAQVDTQNIEGVSPLIAAARNADVKLVTFLVERGARLDFRDRYDRTALMSAWFGLTQEQHTVAAYASQLAFIGAGGQSWALGSPDEIAEDLANAEHRVARFRAIITLLEDAERRH